MLVSPDQSQNTSLIFLNQVHVYVVRAVFDFFCTLRLRNKLLKLVFGQTQKFLVEVNLLRDYAQTEIL